jgi:WD40 repeat protein
MKKLNLLPGRAGWLALLVIALAGCVTTSAQETATTPLDTMTPAVTQIPPPATYTPSPTVAPSPTSPPPTLTPTPTLTPPIPLCAFTANPAPGIPGPSLDAFVFSAPQVVLTHTSAIGVVDWLPDGERLLITRLVVPGPPEEYIDTFNVQTRELRRLGEWNVFSAGSNPKPVWLDAEQVVVFGDIINGQWVLSVSRGPDKVVVDLASPYLAASPDGQLVVFFPETPGNGLQTLDVTQARRQDIPFTLPDPLTPPPNRTDPYKVIWQPGGSRIAFYNNAGFYLVDVITGQICELDLGTHMEVGDLWAVAAKWSPNGRYLAALTTAGEPVVSSIDLTLLDIDTGEPRQVHLGYQYLHAMAWHPNSHALLVMAEAGQGDPARANQYDLYLVDAATGDSRQMLAGHTFTLSGIYGAAWSPTGQEIALGCPAIEPTSGRIAEGRLCIISVEIRP